MFLFESCPHCHGTLEHTLEGDLRCMQCGRYRYATSIARYPLQITNQPLPSIFQVRVKWPSSL